MTLTPAIKGQLTKAINAQIFNNNHAIGCMPVSRRTIQHVFARHMPRQQAKHAAKKYLASK